MLHTRRSIATLIATLIGLATWCIASTSTAYALMPDPIGGDVVPAPPPPIVPYTPVWKFVLVAAIAAVLTVALVGLIASLRGARPSKRSRPSTVLHA
jgi:low affinity Fe/Cu permease